MLKEGDEGYVPFDFDEDDESAPVDTRRKRRPSKPSQADDSMLMSMDSEETATQESQQRISEERYYLFCVFCLKLNKPESLYRASG